jgi:hypothetical protein
MQVECDLIRAEYWIREDAASIVAVPLLARGVTSFSFTDNWSGWQDRQDGIQFL